MLIFADQIDDTRQKRYRGEQGELGNECTRTQEEATVFIEMTTTRLL